MPQEYRSLEWLLSVADMAWEQVTDNDDFNIDCTEKSFESGSNLEAWGLLPNRIHSLCFENTKESIESMLAADRRESATLGIDKATTFLAKLNELEFESKYETIAIRLIPTVEHGDIAFNSESQGKTRNVVLNGGIDAVRFVGLSGPERDAFFIGLAARAVQSFCAQDSESVQKVVRAELYSLEEFLKGSERL